MRTRMPLDQTMTVIAPKRTCADSWWVESPREHFTEQARQRQFQQPPKRGLKTRNGLARMTLHEP